ncbi:MAG: ABC transporter ATP-binding protein [Alphaproteobacteria bacterium]|nr:ABC transporter ATP-binding protein [Alphaproteobacteria bacterium]
MPLLECTGLSRAWGAVRAVDGVDIAVEAGEVRAVIGPNGAGKTTLFNLITGAVPKTAGRVVFRGEDVSRLPPHAVARRGIARTFQVTALFPRLTALENVRLGAQAVRPDAMRPLPVGAAAAATTEAARAALARVGLAGLADVAAGVLSHGDQRLLEVAMALVQRPALLILDEPTQGMSVEETQHTVALLGRVLAAEGTAVLLVEHDLQVVFALARRITVLHRGRRIAEGTPAEVRADAAVRDAYLGNLD